MLASTALTLLLLLDDAFLLHESVFPSFGIPEKLVYFTYMCAVAFYLTVFYKIIFRTEFIYLTLSFLFLGLSIALDVIVPDTSSDYLLEDGLKFLGLVSWMLYFWSVARCEILNQRV